MLCTRKKSAPLDYSNCNQTITVYHEAAPGVYRCYVIHGAFLDFCKNRNIEKTGSRESNAFLLIIPECHAQLGFDYDLKNGDKVLLGIGQAITSSREWSSLIPAKIPGLVVVKYIDPKYWQAKLCHVEAGG